MSKDYADGVAEGQALEKERIARFLEQEHHKRTAGCPDGTVHCPSCFFASSFIKNFLLIHFDGEDRKAPEYGERDGGWGRLDDE